MKNHDARGRFTPGTAPGPGRPRREPQQIRPEDEDLADSLIARANALIKELAALLARYPDD